ncbi:MAG TPA: hypothetical protein VN739_05395, partial [Nitrososphaerales archaeon]|nr:hypothetical protein [Nitrososphaerales archaeon]
MVLLDVYFGTKEEGMKKLRETGEVGSLDMAAFGVLDPRKIEEIGHGISEDKVSSVKCFCPVPEDLIKVIERYREKGANHIAIVTNSFPDKIQMIGQDVLPHFQN